MTSFWKTVSWMEDVIDIAKEPFEGESMEKLFRERRRSGNVKKPIEPYQATLRALEWTVEPAYKDASSPNNKQRTKRKKYKEQSISSSSPTTFHLQPVDVLGNSSVDVAHLLPHHAGCAAYYDKVILGTVGPFQEAQHNTNQLFLQSLIHGSSKHKSGVLARARQKLMANAVAASSYLRNRRKRKRPEEECGEKVEEKVRLLGIKHCALNKIQLGGYANHFDAYPYLLLIPMLTVTEMKQWSPGQAYPVLGLLGNQGDTTDKEVPDYRQVFNECSQCTDEELVKKACDLLTKFVKSLANSLDKREDLDEIAKSVSSRGVDNRILEQELTALKETKARLRSNPVVTVAKINIHKFSKAVAVEKMLDRSTAPDPYLLSLKAAVNWSNYHGEKLLPSACHQDELSVCECCAAVDEYYARHRPPMAVSLEQQNANNLSDLDED